MSEGIITEIEGQKLKLTNLDKMIYPHAGLIKAEMIQYYKEAAKLFLRYSSLRPLTLIRYPDGIEGKKFYSKNKPKWAPKWIKYAELAGDDNQYILTTHTADMVWLANLAAIEIHPMQVRSPEFIYPDHFIFDLDPSPSFKFDDLKEIANQLRVHLQSKGYKPFIKTSGSKGLHIYTPIKPLYDHEVFYASVKKIAQEFIDLHPKTCTLRISKERRLGKVLLDIHRNHKSNSCVAPYSLRAKPHAPISMPFEWENLDDIKHSQQFKLADFAPEQPDAWEGFFDAAVQIHDQKTTPIPVQGLDAYDEKRDFDKTEEPAGKVIHGANDQFVIQLHDASNLHYDLRLEWNGVLLSWAIPRSFPFNKEQNRLAIRTEDHPVKYLDFEGKIPKGEYGGGEMWIMERGRYQMIKKEEKKIHFKLEGHFYDGEYKLINTREKQWLIKLMSGDVAMPIFQPMLASASETLPIDDELIYEVKWDGIRALVYYEEGSVRIYSRSGSELSEKFPELLNDLPIEAERAVLDGEIVVLDEHGVSDFGKVISRMHSSSPEKIKNQAVFYAFDLLYLDGREIDNKPFDRRRALLEVVLKKNTFYRISDTFSDGQALFTAGEKMGIEGVMAKKRHSKYMSGVRSDDWIKVKYRSEIEALIIGYTKGSGDRVDYFGALHLATRKGDDLKYLGKVGSGFNGQLLKDISEKLAALPSSEKLVDESIDEPHATVWVEPKLKCEVRFASWTKNGTLREPVFLNLI